MAMRKDFIITRKTAEIKNTSNNKNICLMSFEPFKHPFSI